ncbi:MAG: DNA/RNA non-specific endonuclease [Sphingobacteriales bacterium]|jgi:endonuclease G|nr:MAG: DNA/RNA non-specific endonuclease [Sphingobacteriales bacterium]
MKYKLIFIVCCFVSTVGFAQKSNKKKTSNPYYIVKNLEDKKLQNINKKIDSLTSIKLPNDAKLIKHKAYYSAYSTIYKQPYWVAHIIPKDILYGSYTRNDGFVKDSLYLNTADSTDYWASGYDRGHLAPAADFRWHKDAIKESFYYTNVAPQLKNFNRGAWSKLETLVREFAIDANEVYVITGAVLNNKLPKLQQGSYQVSIPKYYYKIVYDIYPPEYKAIACMMPNQDISFDLTKYIVSVDSIENLTGFDFMNILPDSIENRIEKQSKIIDWDKNYLSFSGNEISKNYGNNKINTLEAKDMIGKQSTVCGKAVSIKFVENGKSNPTYINLDKKFPDQLFTIVIYENVRNKLSYIPEEKLMNKEICVSGKVEQYKGVPQIILQKEKDIELIEK